MKFNLSKLFWLTFFLSFVPACKESFATQPTEMVKFKQIQLNPGQMIVAEAVNSVSYNPKFQKFFFSLMPMKFTRKTLFSFSFSDSHLDNLKDFLKTLKVDGLPTGPIRQIKTSNDGIFTVFIGWDGSLNIYKMGKLYFKHDFPFDISSVEFGENLLALGDEKGQLYFIDPDKKKVFDSKQIFKGEITSIAWFKETQFIVAGDGDQFFLIEGPNAKTLMKVKVNTFSEKMTNFTGIKHCYQTRINRLVHIPSRRLLLISEGGDYCSRRKITIWKTDSWKMIHEVKNFKYPVRQMVSVYKNDEVILIDHQSNLWRLNLENFHLSSPFSLPNSMFLFETPDQYKKRLATRFTFGTVNSIGVIPDTNICYMGLGSFYKGGSALLFTQLNKNSIDHLIYSPHNVSALNFYVSVKNLANSSTN